MSILPNLDEAVCECGACDWNANSWAYRGGIVHICKACGRYMYFNDVGALVGYVAANVETDTPLDELPADQVELVMFDYMEVTGIDPAKPGSEMGVHVTFNPGPNFEQMPTGSEPWQPQCYSSAQIIDGLKMWEQVQEWVESAGMTVLAEIYEKKKLRNTLCTCDDYNDHHAVLVSEEWCCDCQYTDNLAVIDLSKCTSKDATLLYVREQIMAKRAEDEAKQAAEDAKSEALREQAERARLAELQKKYPDA